MQIVSAAVARPIDRCWRAFTDAATMTAWVPGLRTADVIEARPDGLPLEVRFGFATTLRYALRYTYDLPAHVVRWEPKESALGAVRGFARFEALTGGTRFTYALEHDTGRKAAERAFDNPNTLVEAFSRWMHEDRD
ncbi:MAG: SRPBCC family protein [Deltaproteobacteria bacterium]|nr:SRPBCC family protein [Deltaproteobacteria bacterium]